MNNDKDIETQKSVSQDNQLLDEGSEFDHNNEEANDSKNDEKKLDEDASEINNKGKELYGPEITGNFVVGDSEEEEEEEEKEEAKEEEKKNEGEKGGEEDAHETDKAKEEPKEINNEEGVTERENEKTEEGVSERENEKTEEGVSERENEKTEEEPKEIINEKVIEETDKAEEEYKKINEQEINELEKKSTNGNEEENKGGPEKESVKGNEDESHNLKELKIDETHVEREQSSSDFSKDEPQSLNYTKIKQDEKPLPVTPEPIQKCNPEALTKLDDIPLTTPHSTLNKSDPFVSYIAKPELQKKLEKLTKNFIFGLAIVDFHHIRGPELEYWSDDSTTDESQNDKIKKFSKIWPHLPFQALPDGAHLFDETFTNFTLCYDELKENGVELSIEKINIIDEITNEIKIKSDEVIEMEDPNEGVVTLFGCACIRQIDTKLLKHKEESVKRSVVQKSVVLITRYPIPIQLKEKLSIITKSYFEQLDFEDKSVIKALYENINIIYNKNGFIVEDDDLYETEDKEIEKENIKKHGSDTEIVKKNQEMKIIKESDFYIGLNLKDVVCKMRRNLLIVFKSLLLEQRVLIFSKDLNNLSNFQYCLLSLIPNLIMNLQDCGFPLLDTLTKRLVKPTSLKSSDRGSMLKFMGLPLQLFGEGGFYQPYLTLQQLDYLRNKNTKNFLVGSSNDIVLEHKNDWFDVIVYADEIDNNLIYNNGCKIEILNKELKEKLSLNWQDKKFIDYIIGEVEKNDNEEKKVDKEEFHDEKIEYSKTLNNNLSMNNGNYKGGDDFIRSNFEDYLIGMLSMIKYDKFLELNKNNQLTLDYFNLNEFENNIDSFNKKFIESFKTTRVFKIFDTFTEDELFNFFEPKHIGNSIFEENSFNGKEVLKNFFGKFGKRLDEHEQDKKEPRNTINTEETWNIGKEVGNFFKKIQNPILKEKLEVKSDRTKEDKESGMNDGTETAIADDKDKLIKNEKVEEVGKAQQSESEELKEINVKAPETVDSGGKSKIISFISSLSKK